MERFPIFQGGIIAWLIGIPIIFFTLLLQIDFRQNYLLFNVNPYDDSDVTKTL